SVNRVSAGLHSFTILSYKYKGIYYFEDYQMSEKIIILAAEFYYSSLQIIYIFVDKKIIHF
ncbi:MAG: hypothetical protein II165_07465, partial [Bacteroidales bacterium]|nr:hypothetical protein [Bacteroidales bacterium]